MNRIIQALPGLMDELSGNEVREAVIFSILPTVLGEQLGRLANARELREKTLYVAVSSDEWKLEFKKHAPEIVFKLNRALGSSMVERIEPFVDAGALEAVLKVRAKDRAARSAPPRVSPDLKDRSSAIADSELRNHFLEAAAICIERRESKPIWT